MRIAVGQWVQETNHFSPVPTTLKDFEAFGIRYGKEMVDALGTRGEIGGFLDVASRSTDLELIATMSARAMPSGRLDRATHQFLKTRLLGELRGAGHLDGILLSLHGAMSAEDEYDVEGALLQAIRSEWGQSVPVVISLDHHANITRRMIESADALVGYHTQPHLDSFETGAKAAKLLFSIVRGEVKPTTGWRKLPMIASGNLLAPEGPLGPFFAEAADLEVDEAVLAVSIFPEFPYSDTAELGWTVVAVTDDAPDLAQDIAESLAGGIWEKRELFLPAGRPSPAEAVARALSTEGGPVVLGDYGDNTAGGAPGDGTAVLRELLGRDLGGAALLTVVDPDAVAQAIQAGVGSTVTMKVGGKIDPVHSQPVEVTGLVRTLSDGRYRASGMEVTMGRAAVLKVGDIHILLSELSGPNVDPGIYRSVGLEPREAKIVLVKCAYNFRAYYGPFAQEMIVVDTPGVTSQDLRSLAAFYRMAPRPLWPLEEDARFEA